MESDEDGVLSSSDYPATCIPYKASVPQALRADCHPTAVVESGSLAAIKLPSVTYKLHTKLFEKNAQTGKSNISSLQIEAILLACHSHEKTENGIRAGMLIGDGPGVGKTREICGVLLENALRGRKKSIWVSKSLDLLTSAKSDMNEIYPRGTFMFKSFSKCFSSTSSSLPAGNYCLFTTYAYLRNEPNRKLNAIMNWATKDFDGVIALDECHSAKNMKSKVAYAIRVVSSCLPQARFIYSSATVAEDIAAFHYMERLFLWGEGTAFPDGFDQLCNVVKKAGPIGMESIAMELKHRGSYVARKLDFSKATFDTVHVPLTTQQISMYNNCVDIWNNLKRALDDANEADLNSVGVVDQAMGVATKGKKKKNSNLQQFWTSHQTFFKLLLVSLKIPYLITYIRQHLREGYAVVVGLQTTGEALLKPYRNLPIDTVPSTLFLKFQNFVNSRKDITGSVRRALISRMFAMGLPMNPLDAIIDALGPNKVVELTGRKTRIERAGGKYVWKKIKHNRETRMHQFMSGNKYVVIISEASSSGISLHSDKGVANKRRRLQLTVELSWSAEQVIQQCGRTLRSNQENAPAYKLFVTDVAGEKRFAFGVTEKMKSLGAITQGDRNTPCAGMDSGNLSSVYMQAAVEDTLNIITLRKDPIVNIGNKNLRDFFSSSSKVLDKVGVIRWLEKGPFPIKKISISKLMNRLLGVRLPIQNDIFDFLMDNYQQTVLHNKREGTFEAGVIDYGTSSAYREHSTTFPLQDESTVALQCIMVDVGVIFQTANMMSNGGQFYLTSDNSVFLVIRVRHNIYKFVHPYGIYEQEVIGPIKARKITKGYAQQLWDTEHNIILCRHSDIQKKSDPSCKDRSTKYCEYKNRHQRRYLLTGVLFSNLLVITDYLTLSGIESIQLCRCQLKTKDATENVVGIWIPGIRQARLLQILQHNSLVAAKVPKDLSKKVV